ncbi:helix-turn-helix domain-containing protein [uncultured Catenibacterium sp.]|uniref:helix-turn-helix domain-containing protein n=1 Tax=uncultured Catenibacterium sp. TaxID=286142 RepID=UPI00258EB5E1|nr:helix-turn-helix domain-containing protein [uncultured Catenibacterium sp.]
MQETRKQKDMFVKIPDNFTEQGLTLEHAYIYWRVARFNDGGLPYYESNKTLAEIMGKSESTVKRYIDELVKEGHLYRKTRTRKRLLSIKPFNYEVQNEPYKGYEVQNEPLVEVQNEPHESNESIGESSIRFKMNSNIGQNEPHEGFKMNHYKDNRIDKLIEENQNTKSKDNTYSKTTVKDDIDELKELLSGKYPHDEDFC